MSYSLPKHVRGVYLVGGAVRDSELGPHIKDVKTKDFDFTVEADSYGDMRDFILGLGGTIFKEDEPFTTIRANVPASFITPFIEVPEFHGRKPKMVPADFVLARKDGYYKDGRRPESVSPGTLFDDLARRDFTVNAMAYGMGGEFIDPFNGLDDVRTMSLTAVGNATERFQEDALRVMRAIRFHVVKGFSLMPDVTHAMRTVKVLDALENNIATDRVREELHKCFAHDTWTTMRLLSDEFPAIGGIVLRKGIWLKPTTEER